MVVVMVVFGSKGDEGKKENPEEFDYLLGISCPSLKECFYCAEKQTASLSNYEYLASVIVRVCSALYRLFLQGWSQTQVVNKVCFKCFSVRLVLRVLTDFLKQTPK